MVQQPLTAAPQNVAQTSNALGAPSIVAGQQQSQYSPQASFYQQQLIKSAQQQFMQQPRLNGNHLQPQQHYTSQQVSPSSQPPLDSLYNGAARVAPIYAPKPTYYQTQQQQQQQPQPQQVYQSRQVVQQANFYQGQHSPANMSLPVQTHNGLSIRQLSSLPLNGLTVASPEALSPRQASEQQQMQELFMSYQQQQQQQQQHQLNSEILHRASQQPYLGQEHLVQQHVDVRWSQLDQQQRQPQIIAQGQERLVRANPSSRFSDRDSVSTMSRFNQLDDRRSFTLRSQYTNAQASASKSHHLGFLKLTGEAVKRLLGLGGQKQLQRNLTLGSGPGKSSQTPLGAPKVTAIDSGEDHYFKRRVFAHQLALLRLLNLLSAALVILSPVAMLLIPKLEFLLNHHEQVGGELEHSPRPSSGSGVTHAVGLSGTSALAKQPNYLAPTPQWRISECSSECDAPLIGFVARLLMLCVAYWAIFARSQTASLPRIDFHRCLLTSLALLLAVAYWLFFFFRIFDKRFNDFELQYVSIVQFAVSMLESLILLHYLAVLLLELRNRKKVFCLKVLRSPDGSSHYYSCGSLSIQKCAQFVLEKYHRDFSQCGLYATQMLELQDQLTKSLTEHQNGGDKTPVGSPSARRRSTSRNSRHRSHSRNRSPSPARSTRSRSQRHSERNQVKLYQVDLGPPEAKREDKSESSEPTKSSQTMEQRGGGEENETNSADQSSDATNHMKESSLETIRAANPASNKSSKQHQSDSDYNSNRQQQQQQHQQSARDETESVRSARSRRSASRSHHRRREHRSSSRLAGATLSDAPDELQQSGRRHSTMINMAANGPDLVEEHERKLRRRKLRLLAAVQDTFEQIKQVDEAHLDKSQSGSLSNVSSAQTTNKPTPLGANQTARSMYPRIARSLQKYLRLTGQTGRHNLQSIYEHLAKCVLFRLSPRAFVEKFVNLDPVWQQSETNLFAHCKLQDSNNLMNLKQRTRREHLELNSWSLVCDTLLSRQIRSGTFFVLKQGQVSLLVTVAKLPHLNLSEEVIDEQSCKFVLASNSETSV